MADTCDVCGTPHRLGKMTLPGDATFTVCVWCHEDKDRLQKWLAGLMKQALDESPDYEPLPNGNYKYIGQS
jgi:hypothetical protein